jgi:hypothetical protein
MVPFPAFLAITMSRVVTNLAAVAFLPLLQLAHSYPSTDALKACTDINDIDGFETEVLPYDVFNHGYHRAMGHYWSAANADLYPACVAFPESTESVSDIISVLLNYTDVSFTVKSGGHNPNVGFSNVDGGVLISMSKLASTTLSDDKETADVGPGARWNEASAATIPHGKALVGGRLGKCDDSEVNARVNHSRGCGSWRVYPWRRFEFLKHSVWHGLRWCCQFRGRFSKCFHCQCKLNQQH